MGETMNTLTRVLSGAAAVLVAIASAITFAAPAQAAYAPPPYPTDGQTYVYGVPLAQFKTVPPTSRAVVGGWLNDDWHKRSIGYDNSNGQPYRPLWYELWEPYYNPATSQIRIPVYVNAPQDNQNGGNLYQSGYSVTIDPVNGFVPKVYCQKSEWALAGAATSTSTPLLGSVSGQIGAANGGAMVFNATLNAITLTGATLLNCPYIRQIDVNVGAWNSPGTSPSSAVRTIESWYAKNAFVDHVVYRPYEGLRDVCALTVSTATNPISPGCTDILGAAGKIDGEDFNVVCANPPATWVWGDFSWLGGFIGFYSKCLWAPVNGWDRDGTVARSWSGGPPGQLVAPISSMVSALNLPNNCGVIVPSAPGVLGGVFSINTCSWSWAAQLHDALALILPMWFGWWALWFVVAAIRGVIDRKVPSPAEEPAK